MWLEKPAEKPASSVYLFPPSSCTLWIPCCGSNIHLFFFFEKIMVLRILLKNSPGDVFDK